MTYIILLSIAMWLILLFIISRLCKKIWKEGNVMKEKVEVFKLDFTEDYYHTN